jgi:hypothetical protein
VYEDVPDYNMSPRFDRYYERDIEIVKQFVADNRQEAIDAVDKLLLDSRQKCEQEMGNDGSENPDLDALDDIYKALKLLEELNV